MSTTEFTPCPLFTYTNKYAEKKYSCDINYYHTIHHIYNMLMLAYKDREYIKSITDIDCFLTAIMFHDTIYKMGCEKNEEKSAKYALKCIKKVNFKYKKDFNNIEKSLKINVFDNHKIELIKNWQGLS